MDLRLDKLVASAGLLSRSDAARAIRRGEVTVDGVTADSPSLKADPEKSEILWRGERIGYKRFRYIMLNKPQGYVCSTDDPASPTVTELLGEKYRSLELFPCGRLDKNTTGLVILTDDGKNAHRLLSPRHHAEKKYRFTLKFPMSREDAAFLEAGGVELETGDVTLPCKIELTGEKEGCITLTEGKYHQIKLMAKAVHNAVTSLDRVEFAGIALDPALAPGEYRELSPREEALFTGGK